MFEYDNSTMVNKPGNRA